MKRGPEEKIVRDSSRDLKAKTHDSNPLFLYETIFKFQALNSESPHKIILSHPIRYIAQMLEEGRYSIQDLERPKFQATVELSINNIADIQLSASTGELFYVDATTQKRLFRMSHVAKVDFYEFEKDINYFKLSANGRYLFAVTWDYFNVIDTTTGEKYQYQNLYSYGSDPKFSEDQQAIYFKQLNYDSRQFCIYAWRFIEGSVDLVYVLGADVQQFSFFQQERLLVYAKNFPNEMVLEDLASQKSATYLAGDNVLGFQYLPEHQSLCVIDYDVSGFKFSGPKRFKVSFYNLKNTKLDAVGTLPEDTTRCFYQDNALYAVTPLGLVRCHLNPAKFDKHLVSRSISLRQKLHESSFKLLSISYRITNEYIRSQQMSMDKNRIYYVKSASDWLRLIGHFADQYSRSSLDVGKATLYPCQIIVGPENNQRAIKITNSGVVQFQMPNGRAIGGDSYPDIARYLKSILDTPDNQIKPTDIVYLLQGNLDRELLQNHRELAEVLLRRIVGDAYPKNQYTEEQEYFFDALLVLMLLVEGSRNNSTLVSFVLLMDCIINHVAVNGEVKAYDFINSFFSDSEWDGPFVLPNYGQSQVRKFDRGGLFPMVSHASGVGNFSERKTAIEGKYSKFYNSPHAVNLDYFEKRPQKHHILLQETQLFVDWLLWFANDELQKAIIHPDQLEEIVQRVIKTRIQQVFQGQFGQVIRYKPYDQFAPDSGSACGHIDKTVRGVLFLQHTVENEKQPKKTGQLTYFHKLTRPCRSVPEYVVNKEAKALKKLKAEFTAEPQLGSIRHIGLTRRIIPSFNNGYYECSLGVIRIFNENHIELNGAKISLSPDEHAFLLSNLADYANAHLLFIDREKVLQFLKKELHDLDAELLQIIVNNLQWRRHPKYKHQAAIFAKDILESIPSEIDSLEHRIELTKRIIQLLQNVTKLKSEFVYEENLQYRLFSPKLEDHWVAMNEGGEWVRHVSKTILSDDQSIDLDQHPFLRDLIGALQGMMMDRFEVCYDICSADQSLSLIPCPDCFGDLHDANSLPILDYATPCLIDEKTAHFHALNSSCEPTLQNAQLSYLNDSVLRACKPCPNCWLSLTSEIQSTAHPPLEILKLLQSSGASAQSLFSQQRLQSIEGKQVSPDYWYEDAEMNRLLRIKLGEDNFIAPDQKQVYVYGPFDSISPYGLKDALQDHGGKPGHVLIPFNLGLNHWVGLSLEFDDQGQLVRADFYDSLGHRVPPLLNQILADYAGEHDLKEFNDCKEKCLQQTNGSDCGPCTIANLLASIGYDVDLNMDPVQRRFEHLVWLEKDDRQFYQKVYHQQMTGQASFSQSVLSKGSQLSLCEQKRCKEVAEAIFKLPEPHRAQFLSVLNPEHRNGHQEHRYMIGLLRDAFGVLMQSSYGVEQSLLKSFFYSKKPMTNQESLEQACLIFDYNHLNFLYESLVSLCSSSSTEKPSYSG